jgi:hypothetical protein
VHFRKVITKIKYKLILKNYYLLKNEKKFFLVVLEFEGLCTCGAAVLLEPCLQKIENFRLGVQLSGRVSVLHV